MQQLLLLSLLVLSANCITLHKQVVVNATERNAVCNDGSPAVYYTYTNPDSDRWLIYLEGGGSCVSALSCWVRYFSMHRLMTSKKEPDS